MKILKIGGSIITDKDGYKKPKKKAIERVANEISDAYKDLVLIHGAGSYGHPLVRKHGLDMKNKTKFNKKDYISMEKISRSVKQLNQLFVNKLNEKDIPTHSIHPSSLIITKKGKISHFPLKTIEKSIEKKVIPVLHGDMVIDEKHDGKVISGDKITSYIAKKTDKNIDRIGMATKTAVLDNEKNKIKNFKQKHMKYLSESESTDVTGGMRKKVKELRKINSTSIIFDATKPGEIKKFLKGKEIGTKITK